MKRINLKLIFAIFLLILLVGFTTVYAQKNNNEKSKTGLKNAKKYYFNFNAYKDKNLRKYVDLVWDKYYKKEILDPMPKDSKLRQYTTKQIIGIIPVDLNSDNKKDVITTTHGIPYFCGRSGVECPIMIFISYHQNNYKMVDVSMNTIDDLPIYILNSETNGLKNIILNEKYVLKFDNNNNVYK